MFYCTAGRGTEVFAKQELVIRHIDNEVRVTDGKVYFKSVTENYDKLFDLKSVERVFVQIAHFNTSKLCTKGKHQFLRSLKELVVEKDKLESALVTHRHVTHLSEQREPNEPSNKRWKGEHEGSSPPSDAPTFRVSSKVAGRWGKAFRARNFQEVSQELGREVVRLLGWRVDLRNPEVEICVHINDESVTVGLPITRYPLSKRKYMVQPGLRSTVAWIMAHLADIQTGDVVLDPMCGKASILIEAVQDLLINKAFKAYSEWKHNMPSFCSPHPIPLRLAQLSQLPGGAVRDPKVCPLSFTAPLKAHYMGFDISDGQLDHSMENRMSARTRLPDLGAASVLYLPVRDQSVDKIVCDAPFGYKHTMEMKLDLFYPKLIHHIARVLRVGGMAVVMTSSDLKATLLSCIHTPHMRTAHGTLANERTLSSRVHQTSEEEDNSSGGRHGKDEDCVDSLTTSVSRRQNSNTPLSTDSSCQGPGVITDRTTSDIQMDRTDSEHESHFTKQIAPRKCTVDEESTNAKCESVEKVDEPKNVNIPEGRGIPGESDSPTQSHLYLCSEHYVKLGETHAYIFVLRKENKY